MTQGMLRDLIGRITAVFEPDAALIGALFDIASHDAAVRDQVAELMARSVSALSFHIINGQRHGWIEPELPRRRPRHG